MVALIPEKLADICRVVEFGYAVELLTRIHRNCFMEGTTILEPGSQPFSASH